MGLNKQAWLEALDLGHKNPYVQKILERSIRSNARQELFNVAGVPIKNTPGTDALISDEIAESNGLDNDNSDIDRGATNVPKRST